MACGCGSKKTPEQLLAVQQRAEAKRAVLKQRLEARRAAVVKARSKQ